MIQYITATNDDIELLMSSRLEMLKVVNNLSDDYEFSEELVTYSKEYFEKGNQTTILAIDEEIDSVIGCATLCYIEMMPTFSHPTGKRAHLMNVYTNQDYRRKGIAMRMIERLIIEARDRGVTEISLDATETGRPLYEKCGFKASDECMTLNLD